VHCGSIASRPDTSGWFTSLNSGAQNLLANIRRTQLKLSEAHERSKTVTRSAEMKEIRERMQTDIDEVNKTAHQVKNKLEHLDKLNEQALSRKVNPTPGSMLFAPPSFV
jgi:hypothetical protein